MSQPYQRPIAEYNKAFAEEEDEKKNSSIEEIQKVIDRIRLRRENEQRAKLEIAVTIMANMILYAAKKKS